MKFRITSGSHIEPHPTKKDLATGLAVDVKYTQGQIVETPRDLHAIFDQPGMPPKFVRVDEYIEQHNDGLDTLDDKELIELARKNRIDLRKMTEKPAVLKILRAYGVQASPELVEA